MPDQPLGGQVHCVCIKVRENTPRKPCIQRQRRAAIDDAIFIRPPNAGKAGMPVVVHGAAIDDRHRIWAKLRVQRLRQPEGRDRIIQIDMCDLPARMDARVGAAGGMDHRQMAGDALQRFLDRLLDGRAMRLPLPAHEGAAVIFHRQAKAGHPATVPGGRGLPRSSAPGSIAPLPCRWARVGRMAPLPQAMVSLSPSTTPGEPLSAVTSAAKIFSRSPAISTHAPRSEEHTSELQSLMRISYAVFCLKKKQNLTISM